jgi:hypothetical protein
VIEGGPCRTVALVPSASGPFQRGDQPVGMLTAKRQDCRQIMLQLALGVVAGFKISRRYPRRAPATPGQTYEPEVPVEMREWISPASASSDLVF